MLVYPSSKEQISVFHGDVHAFLVNYGYQKKWNLNVRVNHAINRD